MCTVILLRRPGHDWPLIIAANRDEMRDRPWLTPARHWPDRPEVTAGLDELGGGSWFGHNDHGVVAAILNRQGSLGPQPGKRSRGEIVLDALDSADARDAARDLGHLDPDAYRPFNLIIADNREAFWLAHRGTGRLHVAPIRDGISMITASELNAPGSTRIHRYIDRFRKAEPPDPEHNQFSDWQKLLEDRLPDPKLGPDSALTFARESGFGTVMQNVLAVPAPGLDRPIWWRYQTPLNPSAPDWQSVSSVIA